MTTTISVFCDFYDLDGNLTDRVHEHESTVEEWYDVAGEIEALRVRYELTEKTDFQWHSELTYSESRMCRVVLEVRVGRDLIPVGIFGSVQAG